MERAKSHWQTYVGDNGQALDQAGEAKNGNGHEGEDLHHGVQEYDGLDL